MLNIHSLSHTVCTIFNQVLVLVINILIFKVDCISDGSDFQSLQLWQEKHNVWKLSCRIGFCNICTILLIVKWLSHSSIAGKHRVSVWLLLSFCKNVFSALTSYHQNCVITHFTISCAAGQPWRRSLWPYCWPPSPPCGVSASWVLMSRPGSGCSVAMGTPPSLSSSPARYAPVTWCKCVSNLPLLSALLHLLFSEPCRCGTPACRSQWRARWWEPGWEPSRYLWTGTGRGRSEHTLAFPPVTSSFWSVSWNARTMSTNDKHSFLILCCKYFSELKLLPLDREAVKLSQTMFPLVYVFLVSFNTCAFCRCGLFPAVWVLWLDSWRGLLPLQCGSTTTASSSRTSPSDELKNACVNVTPGVFLCVRPTSVCVLFIDNCNCVCYL